MPIYIVYKNELPQNLLPKERIPEKLWIECNEDPRNWLSTLQENALAVVGTRNATPKTQLFMNRVFEGLKDSNRVILSGLASGVDTQAHLLAIRHGMQTIAFLGNGLSHTYPKENHLLQRQIIESGGALITEWSPETPPQPFQFILRNRLIASFARVVWFVEGKMRSGALGTVAYASDQHREIFATPSFPGDPAFTGCESVLHEGHAKAVWSAQSFGSTWLDLSTKKEPAVSEDDLSQKILEKLQNENSVSLEKIHDWSEEWAVHPGVILERLSKLTER